LFNKSILKIKHFCLIIFFLSGINTYAQNIIIGNIQNESNEIVTNASVVLKDGKKIIAYVNANLDGKYELKTDKIGKFVLTFNAFNYETFSVNVEITNQTKIIEKNIILVFKSTEIQEIIIKHEKPISVKKDTIVFNAKAFLQGNEQVVEDLLKKIPGLSVSSDGIIKVGNQEVEKVMIDGDDFFEKGYKILTKNMPVQPVEKVELYEHYSNNKHLKGIENSNKVALNLKLKDDFKRQWFGNTQLGYGLFSKNRYEVRSNLMNFGKNNKYYFLSNLNNTGEDATGDIDHLIRPFRFNEPSSLGDNQNANILLGLNTESPNLKQKRVNFNNAEMLSLNSIFTITPKIKLKTLGFFNSDENDFYKNTFLSFLVGSTSFENTEDFYGRKTKVNGFGKIDFTYDVSKTKTLEYTTKFNVSEDKGNSNLFFNGSLLNEKLNNKNQLFDQKIVFTNKMKANKVLIFSGRYIKESTPQIYKANQFLYQDLFSANANNVIQSAENKMQFLGFESHFMNRNKNNDLLEIQFGNQFRKDNLISNFLLKNNEIIIDEPSNYSNASNYSCNDLYFNTQYLFKFSTVSLSTRVELHQFYNKLELSKSQNPFFINPKIGFNWEMNKKNKVSTSLSINKTNASILDVYNGYIQTGIRSFSKGTGDFSQLDASSAFLSYTYGSWSDKFFANSFFTYTKNYDFFSSNTSVVQNYSLSEKIIIKDREILIFSNTIDRYIKLMSSNIKFSFGGSKSNYKNIVNDTNLREVRSSSLNYGFEVRSSFEGFFNYNFGTKSDFTKIETSITNSFTNRISFIDLFFIFDDKLSFEIKTEQYYFGNLEKENNKYYFMDLEARYTFKANKLTFSLSGNNLFNTETFRNYNITDISISKTEYRLQPRYLLLKMEFRF
jgi:hypothetical protein